MVYEKPYSKYMKFLGFENRYRNLNQQEIIDFFRLLPPLSEILKPEKRVFFKYKKRVLDLGCGFGNLIFDLKQKYDVEAYGVDLILPTEDEITKIDENFKEKANLILRNVTFIKKDLKFLKPEDVKNKKFDLIYSFRTFMYVDYKYRLALICYYYNHFLKKDGYMLIDISGSQTETSLTEEDKTETFAIFRDTKGEFFEGFELIEFEFKGQNDKQHIIKILKIKKVKENLAEFKK